MASIGNNTITPEGFQEFFKKASNEALPEVGALGMVVPMSATEANIVSVSVVKPRIATSVGADTSYTISKAEAETIKISLSPLSDVVQFDQHEVGYSLQDVILRHIKQGVLSVSRATFREYLNTLFDLGASVASDAQHVVADTVGSTNGATSTGMNHDKLMEAVGKMRALGASQSEIIIIMDHQSMADLKKDTVALSIDFQEVRLLGQDASAVGYNTVSGIKVIEAPRMLGSALYGLKEDAAARYAYAIASTKEGADISTIQGKYRDVSGISPLLNAEDLVMTEAMSIDVGGTQSFDLNLMPGMLAPVYCDTVLSSGKYGKEFRSLTEVGFAATQPKKIVRIALKK